MKVINRLFPQLRKISMEISEVDPDALLKMLPEFKNLTSLQIRFMSDEVPSDDVRTYILYILSNKTKGLVCLTKLKLTELYLQNLSFTSLTMKYIVSMTTLQKLWIYNPLYLDVSALCKGILQSRNSISTCTLPNRTMTTRDILLLPNLKEFYTDQETQIRMAHTEQLAENWVTLESFQ
jgi:hypothetical protein